MATRAPTVIPALRHAHNATDNGSQSSAGVIGNVVGQLEGEVLMDRDVAGERAVDGWGSEEDNVPTQVVVAGAALPAGAARNARL